MQDWIAAFPNVMFGITATILLRRATADNRSAIRNMPNERLLLETDAPDLQPPHISGYGTPWMLSHTCYRVARLRAKRPDQVWELSANYAREFYNIP